MLNQLHTHLRGAISKIVPRGKIRKQWSCKRRCLVQESQKSTHCSQYGKAECEWGEYQEVYPLLTVISEASPLYFKRGVRFAQSLFIRRATQ